MINYAKLFNILHYLGYLLLGYSIIVNPDRIDLFALVVACLAFTKAYAIEASLDIRKAKQNQEVQKVATKAEDKE